MLLIIETLIYRNIIVTLAFEKERQHFVYRHFSCFNVSQQVWDSCVSLQTFYKEPIKPVLFKQRQCKDDFCLANCPCQSTYWHFSRFLIWYDSMCVESVLRDSLIKCFVSHKYFVRWCILTAELVRRKAEDTSDIYLNLPLIKRDKKVQLINLFKR